MLKVRNKKKKEAICPPLETLVVYNLVQFREALRCSFLKDINVQSPNILTKMISDHMFKQDLMPLNEGVNKTCAFKYYV